MAQPRPPFRADHVGSLLRPASLKARRLEREAGRIGAEQLAAEEDASIREVVKLQEDVGLQSITDGEFRRDWWHIDFLHGFDGVELAPTQYADDAKFKNIEEQPPFMQVKSKIRRTKPSMLEHFQFLKSVTTRTPKVSIPSPTMLHFRGGREAISRWRIESRTKSCTKLPCLKRTSVFDG